MNLPVFQLAVMESEPIGIPLQDFQLITTAVAEHEPVWPLRVKFQYILDQQPQGIDGFAHVGDTSSQIDVPGRCGDHGRDSIDQYLDLLESLEHSLPIPVMPELTDVEIALRLLAASNGMLGMIKELLAEGVSSAYLSGKTSIQLEDFIHAYEVINGPDVPNPFSTPFDKLMVKQIESYEEYVPDANTGELKFIAQIFNELSIKALLG